jgi:hypothetical protein
MKGLILVAIQAIQYWFAFVQRVFGGSDAVGREHRNQRIAARQPQM